MIKSEVQKRVFNYIFLFLFVGSCLCLALFVLMVAHNLLSNTLLGHVDSNVASVAWLVQQGHPLYLDLDAPSRYNMFIHGPILYLTTGFFLKIFQPSIFATKLPFCLSLILGLIVSFLATKKVSRSSIATVLTACISLGLIGYGNLYTNTLFQLRSDSLIFFCVSLGVLGIALNKNWIGGLFCAIGCGLAINLKITSVLYFFPIYIILFLRSGAFVTFVSAIGLIATAYLPFLLPNISIQNYFMWIDRAATHGLSVELLRKNFTSAIYLGIPVLGSFLYLFWLDRKEFKKTWKATKYYIYALIISMMGTVVVAAKPGSGAHHLAQYLPLIAYLLALLTEKIVRIYEDRKKLDKNTTQKSQVKELLALLMCSIFFLSFISKTGFKGVILWEILDNTLSSMVISDIEEVINKYPSETIEMGYGSNRVYPLTYYRPILVFAGNPYLVDGTALMDMQAAGIEIPESTIEVLQSCKTKIWLIPGEDPPFSQPNYFPPHSPIFSEQFIRTFLENYEWKENSKYFSLWSCKSS